ncbi:MAG TPA: hypothetical protein VFI06_12240, partial [Chitinophagaceae bacterium]|nr:hypothetical protein [Chitinophagaceae bacterium]
MTRFRAAAFIVLPIVTFITLMDRQSSAYADLYSARINEFQREQDILISSIETRDHFSTGDIEQIKKQIFSARLKLKAIDFWLRYLEPIAYKKINGPLPVEWETEVFEKFEKPYKRSGAGLTLAELYLDEPAPEKKELLRLLHE